MNPAHRYTVQHFIRKDPLTVPVESTLAEVMKAMKDKSEHFAVVLGENGKVAGVISSWDILRIIVPDYMENDEHIAPFVAEHDFADRTKQMAKTPVKSIMTANVVAIHPEDSLMKAAALMTEHHIHCLPVFDASGNLLGAVKQSEMRNAICEILS